MTLALPTQFSVGMIKSRSLTRNQLVSAKRPFPECDVVSLHVTISDIRRSSNNGKMNIGYARVSTQEQRPELQIDALTKAGCDSIYSDCASGATSHRVQLDLMMDTVVDGDVVVVWKLDRLGRSVANLVDLVEKLGAKGVGFRSLTENMDTTSAGGTLIFNVFAAVAQFERDLIRERTMAGLQAARVRGRKGGRPSVLDKDTVQRVHALRHVQGRSVNEIVATMGIGRTSVYKALSSHPS